MVKDSYSVALHLIHELHPDPITEGFADEHPKNDGANACTKEAKCYGNEIAYPGSEDKKGCPRSTVFNPMLNSLEACNVKSEVFFDPFYFSETTQSVAGHASERVSECCRHHARPIGAAGKQDARQDYLRTKRQDRCRKEEAMKTPIYP